MAEEDMVSWKPNDMVLPGMGRPVLRPTSSKVSDVCSVAY